MEHDRPRTDRAPAAHSQHLSIAPALSTAWPAILPVAAAGMLLYLAAGGRSQALLIVIASLTVLGTGLLAYARLRLDRELRGLEADLARRQESGRETDRPDRRSLPRRARALRRQLERWADSQRDEAAKLRSRLERAERSAEAAELAKDELLACASHQLRTPMTGILGYSFLLLGSRLSQEQQNLAAQIRDCAQDLSGEIDQILTYAALAAEETRVETLDVDVRALVNGIVDRHRTCAGAKGLRLSYSVDRIVPEKVLQDPDLISQALDNLVDNAVKLTTHGSVSILVTVAPGEETGLRFVVRDTGAGVAASTLEELFEPFTQADSSNTRLHEGLGLGLAVSYRIVDRLGGHLEAESTPGVGSCFRFDVPVEVFKAAPVLTDGIDEPTPWSLLASSPLAASESLAVPCAAGSAAIGLKSLTSRLTTTC